MRQFVTATDAFFADLECQAAQACVRFQARELPPGTDPNRACIGFEVNVNGTVVLLVEKGVQYHGANQGLRAWLTQGEQRFTSLAALRQWLVKVIGPEFQTAHQPQSLSVAAPAKGKTLPVERLTDLAAVRAAVHDAVKACYLDEQALFRELSLVVRGQDGALWLLCQRLARHLARQQPRRPATFFAVGPTGVGKTKTAETLPLSLRTVLPDASAYGYLRLDMCEYQEAHRVSQLLGAPQGYVGHGDGAQLVDTLLANPRTVVLFDEIEKAHPNILRTLMNAMDAGRLSAPGKDANSREIDCRQAVFFFTSNLEAAAISSDLQQCQNPSVAMVDDICRRRLRASGLAPELVGRISCFLVFQPLTSDTCAEVVALAIARAAEEYGLRLEYIEPMVISQVLEAVRAQGFGARPYEYIIDDLLGDCLIKAARTWPTVPVVLTSGPPFGCAPKDGCA